MITKTDFLLYLEAPMHLWAKKHNQLEVVALTTFERHLVEQGIAIEKLCRSFLEEYVARHYTQPRLEWQRTFVDNAFQARADCLVFDPRTAAHDLYEIKSSTSVRKEDRYDATFQKIVCEASIPIRNVYIVHLNKDYIHQGSLDLDDLFQVVNITSETEAMQEDVMLARQEAFWIANSDTPDGILECNKPNHCPCLNLCHPDLPDYPIYDLPRLNLKKARDLRARGIRSIMDIPDDYPLSERQLQHVNAVKLTSPFIDLETIKHDLVRLEYPIYFLDYETYNPGVPLCEQYKPYQHMVFQFSLHIMESWDSQPTHIEFLTTERGDPGIELVRNLVPHMGNAGSVVVWNKSFEMARNKELAEMYPQYREVLLNINDRIYDLMEIFFKGYFIHPDLHGSASIKNVLPILIQDEEFSYENLPISQSDEAMMAWVRIMQEDLPEEEIQETRANLLRYCKLDTLAMVKIWQSLNQLLLDAD